MRTDSYCGSAENRARLGLDTVFAVAREVGADRVSGRPHSTVVQNIQGVLEEDPNDARTPYGVLICGIAPLGLAYPKCCITTRPASSCRICAPASADRSGQQAASPS